MTENWKKTIRHCEKVGVGDIFVELQKLFTQFTFGKTKSLCVF